MLIRTRYSGLLFLNCTLVIVSSPRSMAVRLTFLFLFFGSVSLSHYNRSVKCFMLVIVMQSHCMLLIATIFTKAGINRSQLTLLIPDVPLQYLLFLSSTQQLFLQHLCSCSLFHLSSDPVPPLFTARYNLTAGSTISYRGTSQLILLSLTLHSLRDKSTITICSLRVLLKLRILSFV